MSAWNPSPHIQALATSVMGGIDTDANAVGFNKPWTGRVWAFVPNGRGVGAAYGDRILQALTAGEATEAVVLTHNYHDTSWHIRLQGRCKLMCCVLGRLKFTNEFSEFGTPPCGQSVLYFGRNEEMFLAAFQQVGGVLRGDPFRLELAA